VWSAFLRWWFDRLTASGVEWRGRSAGIIGLKLFRELELTRQRKIKEPCPICAASRALCLCDLLPRIELSTRVCLVIHHRELSRSSNTGLIALRALINSEMRVRGEGREPLNLKDLLVPQYRTLLLYPSDDAAELTKSLVLQERTPIQLIVPDGTWRQARKVRCRHHELKDVPRVKIGTPNDSTFQLRAQSRPEGMATLQAIARALGVIEGELVEEQLMKLYHAKLERTLMGRGILRATERIK
jgi:DTW domain-containing protein YfiP